MTATKPPFWQPYEEHERLMSTRPTPYEPMPTVEEQRGWWALAADEVRAFAQRWR